MHHSFMHRASIYGKEVIRSEIKDKLGKDFCSKIFIGTKIAKL